MQELDAGHYGVAGDNLEGSTAHAGWLRCNSGKEKKAIQAILPHNQWETLSKIAFLRNGSTLRNHTSLFAGGYLDDVIWPTPAFPPTTTRQCDTFRVSIAQPCIAGPDRSFQVQDGGDYFPFPAAEALVRRLPLSHPPRAVSLLQTPTTPIPSSPTRLGKYGADRPGILSSCAGHSRPCLPPLL